MTQYKIHFLGKQKVGCQQLQESLKLMLPQAVPQTD
jgi:hypothetical protein